MKEVARKANKFLEMMKDQKDLGLIVLAMALLLSAMIFALATRYTTFAEVGVLDRWTGKVYKINGTLIRPH
jgi:hypothetical protein